MPCACSNRQKNKYIKYNIPPLPIGTRLATEEERERAPLGTRYITIEELKRNPLLLTGKRK